MMSSALNRFRLPAMMAAVAAAAWVQPLSAGDKDAVAGAKGTVVFGGAPKHVVVIHTEDGKMTVQLDGKELPTGRIRHEDGRIIILDDEGNEIKSFGLHMPKEGEFEFIFDDWPSLENIGNAWDEVPAEPPAVMIGIHMSEPDEALRYHLRLEEGQTTMISGIYEDLPAHAAGLGRYDVIVAVDGNRPADPETVRAALAKREPGDKITLTVIHEGRTKDVEVELAAYDAEQLDESRLIGGISTPQILIPEEGLAFEGPKGQQWQRYLFDPKTQQYFLKWFDSGQFEEALRNRLPQDLDDRMRDLNERIDQLQEMIDELLKESRSGGGTGGKRTEAPLMAQAY